MVEAVGLANEIIADGETRASRNSETEAVSTFTL